MTEKTKPDYSRHAPSCKLKAALGRYKSARVARQGKQNSEWIMGKIPFFIDYGNNISHIPMK